MSDAFANYLETSKLLPENIKQAFLERSLQTLIEDALKTAFTDCKPATINGVERVVTNLLSSLYDRLEQIKFDDMALKYLQENIAHLFPSNKVYYCRECGQAIDEAKYKTCRRNDGTEIWNGTCFLLCDDCTQEFIYRKEDKTATCEMCEIRFKPRYTPWPIQYGDKLCGQCIEIPFIIEDMKTVKQHNTRAIKSGMQGTLTIKQWRETLAFFEYKCAYCSGKYTAMEHWIPIKRGGNTEQANCFPSCIPCNSRKSGDIPEEFCVGNLFPTENIQRIKKYIASLKRAENRHGEQLAALFGIE